jgi:TPR repeat protein
MEMNYFLGVAYLQARTVPQDTSLAQRWLQRAASLGSRTALAQLGAAGAGNAAPAH